MVTKFIILAVAITLAAAAPRQKRQLANCADPFKNVPSPCQNNPTNRVYFPHPTDASKFLQCDVYNRMYIIQCPAGEVFDIQSSSCRVYAPIVTAAPATAAPFVPVTAAPYVPPVTAAPAANVNPCNPQAIARGQFYFEVVGDRSKFIECDLAGNPNVLSCPTGLLWQEGLLSCVYPLQSGGAGPAQPVNNLTGQITNPCTQQAIASDHFFFPHPNPTKFIQCDLWGQVFVVDCPPGLLWNAYQETCYGATTINGKK